MAACLPRTRDRSGPLTKSRRRDGEGKGEEEKEWKTEDGTWPVRREMKASSLPPLPPLLLPGLHKTSIYFGWICRVAVPRRDKFSIVHASLPSPSVERGDTRVPPSEMIPLKWNGKVDKEERKKRKREEILCFLGKELSIIPPPPHLAFLFCIKFKNQWWRFDKKEEETRGGEKEERSVENFCEKYSQIFEKGEIEEYEFWGNLGKTGEWRDLIRFYKFR